jgi:hypothetical protein
MGHPEDRIPLGGDDPDDGPDLGPDERDADLMDGTWEQDYYAGRVQQRNWGAIMMGLSLLLLLAILIPVLVLFTR